jgi:hypothetical protein
MALDDPPKGSMEYRSLPGRIWKPNSLQMVNRGIAKMNNRHNQPRYRFDPTPPPPAYETREERLTRMLEVPGKDIENNQAFLAALKATVAADRQKRK